MIVAIQGVQGSGKSTLVKKLCKNPNYDCVSLDDFYLPKHKLDQLYYFTREPLWKQRGNPGTHDIKLLIEALHNFKHGAKCYVPIYDKTLYNGQGDRVGYRSIEKADVLFVEGWCIGFKSTNGYDNIDNQLKDYEKMYACFDSFIILKPPSLDIVYKWREEAECKVREELNDEKYKNAMSKDEIKQFIDMYMPVYKKYMYNMYACPPIRPTLLIQLNEDRLPVRAHFIK